MKTVTKKAVLDRCVAMCTGQKVRDVSIITEVFLAAIRDELSKLNEVHLDGLGHLRVFVQTGRVDSLAPKHFGPIVAKSAKKYNVSFRKAAPLTRAIRERHGGAVVEKVMEKLGVDESQSDNEKVASEGCPECGAKVERHGNVLACPTHGTEPFEKKK